MWIDYPAGEYGIQSSAVLILLPFVIAAFGTEYH